MRRLGDHLRRAILGRHLRELHFYFGTVEPRDIVATAVRYATDPRRDHVHAFEARAAARMGVPEVISFGAGRMALYAIMKALGIGPGDEVIMPAFTCVVVPNAVRYLGATPVFVDIERGTWNIDPRGVERALTSRTRAVVVQHTFGVPAEVRSISEIVAGRGVGVIEDCAHVSIPRGAVGALGRQGDAAFFSFESTKPLTLGRGGIAVAKDERLARRIREVWTGSAEASTLAGARAAVRLLVLAILHRPSVHRFGRFLSALLFRLGVFHANITPVERWGSRPAPYPTRMTAYQAALGARQLERIDAIDAHRSRLVERYDRAVRSLGLRAQATRAADPVPLLRYAFLLEDPERAVRYFADRQIELGRWFDSPVVPVAPSDPEFATTGYVLGSCPVAEEVCARCVNLPTDPTITQADAERTVGTLEAFVRASATVLRS